MVGLHDRLEIPAGDGGSPTIATWREAGRAQAVLVVHGILGHRRLPEIERLAEALAPARDVLSIDVRGHGEDARRFAWGREEWRQVADAVAWLRRGASRVDVIGFSFGGYHAARAAGRGVPVDRLVLVGAPADLNIFDHFWLGPGFWRMLPHAWARPRRRPRFERPPWLHLTHLPAEELAAIAAPTLVVHSGADWIVPRRHAARLAGAIPGARLVEIPGGLHAEYALHSHPDRFLDEVGRFLADETLADPPGAT